MSNYKSFAKGFIGSPTLPISSDFGKRNFNGEISMHHGIDIAVPSGTPLKSPIDGIIETKKTQKDENGNVTGGGLYVTIKQEAIDGSCIYVLLMHLSSVKDEIQVGVPVKAGQMIGATGGDPVKDKDTAGTSTGAHLHLEVRLGGNYNANAIDPKPFFTNDVLTKNGIPIVNVFFSQDSIPDNSVKSLSGANTLQPVIIPNATEYKPKKAKKQNTIAKERLAPGIWQITKMLIDSSVAEKQVLDSSISTQQGSLLNFFRKVCQEPLVEFMGETFGNQYYWIVRKPPFDKESFERMMDLTLISLDEADIMSTDLTWNNQGIYSWYQYVPYADLINVKDSALYVPAIFFPEFASVWGSRPLCIESNYFNFVFSGKFNLNKSENKENGNRILQNAVRDLKYIIESNAYNAFTRRGTITLIGDRRIKRGTLIKLPTTNEIFYVDAVNNTYNVNINGVSRTTVLQVSKGMYPEYIRGKNIWGKTYSYFNIIEFGDNFDVNKVTFENWKDYLSKWKVNVDNFGFFMSKQQLFQETISNDLQQINSMLWKTK